MVVVEQAGSPAKMEEGLPVASQQRSWRTPACWSQSSHCIGIGTAGTDGSVVTERTHTHTRMRAHSTTLLNHVKDDHTPTRAPKNSSENKFLARQRTAIHAVKCVNERRRMCTHTQAHARTHTHTERVSN